MAMVSTRITDEQQRRRDGQPDERPFYRIFLFHHTHWDREWWTTYQAFRVRLVEVIDELLDALASDPEFRTFLLDCQVIVLRDYLEIRPENREKLVRFMQEGRIQCGPWYILPDEFLVSGEAHIRNFLLGRRVACELDCHVPDIGYIPDMFGHIGQMPQLLHGFGIDNAFIWRGRGGSPETIKQEFRWEAPDGSAVLTHWFPFGYYWMPLLHFGNSDRPYEDKQGRIHRAIEAWGPRATTDVLLMPYGGDHRPIDRLLPGKIAEANQAIAGLGEIRWATAEEYISAVREQNPELETVRGELRAFGPDNPYLLPGVLSTRLYLKRMNVRGQTWLERYAEPFSTLAWLHGRRYDAGLLWKAWELLIQNHPHDSICGCSIDEVHREMVSRFEQSRQIADLLTERCAQFLNGRIDAGDLGPHDRALVVHNSLPRERSGLASVWIERPGPADMPISPRTHRLLDSEGREVPFQTKEVEGQRPLTDRWRYTEIGFAARDVPGLGYRAYRLARREVPLDSHQLFFTALQPSAMLKGSDAVTDLAVGNNVLENAFLRVEVDGRDGTLSVTDKASGEVYRGLNAFEDGGDAGDTYNYSAPLGDMVLRSFDNARVHVSIAEAGYAQATLRVDLDWALPAELSADSNETPGVFSRSSSYLDTRISTYVTLTSNSRRVEIATEWENRSKDHRLRALFPLGSEARFSHAQGQFEIARRPVAAPSDGNGWPEPHVPAVPQQGWVAVEDGRRGLMVANRGLPEFEILRDGRGTIALTILRAVGWLSREDMLARSHGAGPEIPTPEAQCLGHNRVSYALIPYTGSWLDSRSYLTAEEYLVPLYGSAIDSFTGLGLTATSHLPQKHGLLEVEGNHTLLLSACKKAERSDALILRFWNLAQEPTLARLRLAQTLKPATVQLVDLKEEPLNGAVLPPDEDGNVTLHAGPAQIVTVALVFGDRNSPLSRGWERGTGG